MAALLLLGRLVQDYVNSPHIMGDSVQLQPLTVLLALMLGGQLGGIAGVYLSVPAVAEAIHPTAGRNSNSVSHSITDRSMTFCSSRMFLGHG